jgi:hypothetical protein
MASRIKLASFLVLIACGGTEPESKSLLFEGTITAAGTGAPIPGADILVGGGSDFSIGLPTQVSANADANGHYTLSHPCVYNPSLLAFAPGYYLASKKVACGAERQTADISLTPDPTAP